MRSSFYEFNVAISGLFTARANLDVVSHNIANSAIKGYSRQYAEQRASSPLTFFDGRGMYGTGSEVYGVGQLRNFYLDKKYWSERPILGEYAVKKEQLSLMESIFNELSETGLNTGFQSFFSKLQDLSTNASDSTYRMNLLQAASSLATFVNSSTESIKKQQNDINSEVGAVVTIINSLGSQIAGLNRQISTFELDGSRANDLRDERARLIDELSTYVNVSVEEREMNDDYAAGKYPDPSDRGRSNKHLIVSINGYEFVNHYDANYLKTVPREGKTNPMDVVGLYDIRFANSGTSFDIYSPTLKGQLKGLIDIRDGNNGRYLETGRINTAAGPGVGETTLTLSKDAAKPWFDDLYEDGKVKLYDKNSGVMTELKFTNLKLLGNGDVQLVLPAGQNVPANLNTNYNAVIARTTNYKGIPHYLNKMNELVRVFARAVNEGLDSKGDPIKDFGGHVSGYDVNGQLGLILFSYRNNTNEEARTMDYRMLTCENFSVSKILLEKPEKVASARDYNADKSDNKIIFGILGLKDNSSLFREGKITDYIAGLSGEMGIDKKQANNFYKNYSDVTTQIDNQRMAVSGVSLNEEMIELVKYQQLYQAAAKLVNTIDSIYDTLINRIGV